MPAIHLPSLALAAAAAAPATNPDESVEKWVMSSTTDIAFLLKGALMGLFAGLLLASLTCCWLPCLHFLYGNPGEHLHDLQIASLRLRFWSDGGVREGVMRRVRWFFMGRERPAALAPDAELANGTGGDGARDHHRQGGPARGRQRQQPAAGSSASERRGYNPYDVSHHRYIRDEEDEVLVLRDWVPRVYLPSQRPIIIPSA